jgi:hypothetical protein
MSTKYTATDHVAKTWNADAPLHLSAQRGVVISPTFLGGLGWGKAQET